MNRQLTGLVLTAAVVGGLMSGTARAQAASDDDIAFANRLSNAFKTVASAAEPAVVHITALQQRQQIRYDWFGMPVERGPVQMQPTGLGSGFFVDSSGTIITNNHVITRAQELRVRLADGREFPAKLVGADEATDLAVLRVDAGSEPLGVTPLKLGDSESLDVGEWVVAIGSPFGFRRTVTAGIVSAKGRSLTPRETGQTFEDFIQTDAAINPGNSGGPLLNLRGEVVGINSAIASRTGGYEGLGFAIPANLARAVADNIEANGRVVRGYMGLGLREPELKDLNGFRPTNNDYRGVYVTSVEEDSPAADAGLREGDIILRFQGQPVNESRLRSAIGVTKPGVKADIEILRNGKKQAVTATVGDYAAILSARAATQSELPLEELGAVIRTYTRAMAKADGYRDARVRGVQVVSVRENGPAARSGLREGDIIVEVGGQAITDSAALAQRAGTGRLGPGTVLGIVRGNRMGSLRLSE